MLAGVLSNVSWRVSCNARAANGRASRLAGGRISGTILCEEKSGRDGFDSMSWENLCASLATRCRTCEHWELGQEKYEV